MIKKWSTLSSEEIFDCRLLKVYKHKRVSPRNRLQSDFFSLEMDNWVQIIPVNEKKQIILVEQFRHGTEEITLEFPAGVINKNESPREAAIRELKEETGHVSDDISEIGYFHPNPAYQSNKCFIFLSENLKQIEEQQLDSMEDISIRKVSITELYNLISENHFSHGVCLAALCRIILQSKGTPFL